MNNRPIKFRAWDATENMMHFFGLMDLEKPRHLGGQVLYKKDDYEGYFSIHRQPVMQFTGLLDKNGKEIYEGDILVIPNDDFLPDNGRDPSVICSVVYNNGGFRTPEIAFSEVLDEKYCKDESEIIGNIWENPDLLALHKKPSV